MSPKAPDDPPLTVISELYSMATMRHLRWSLAAWTLLGCADPGLRLAVDVRTDAVPGVEFFAIETEVFLGARTDEGLPAARFATAAAPRGTPFGRGQRVATFDGLSPGTYTVRVRLVRGDARTPLLTRRVLLEVQRDRVLAITLDRGCLDVACPGESGSAGQTECVGGRCVEPSCVPPDPTGCEGLTLCDAALPCTRATAACAELQCVDGVCLALPLEGACAAEQYCDPGAGCRLPGEDPSDRCGTICRSLEEGCETGYWNCSRGAPFCDPFLRRPVGDVCSGGVCDGAGRCVDCPERQPCRVGCALGTFRCDARGGGARCVLDGALAPPGERCEEGVTCVGDGPCPTGGLCLPDGSCTPDGEADLIVTPERDLETSETGDVDELTLQLSIEPVAEVRVELTVDLPAEVALEPSSFVFFPGRATMPRVVVVRGLDDGLSDGDQRFEIRIRLESADARYDGIERTRSGTNGALVLACEEGQADCDGLTGSGCEADLASDATCGSCTQRCEGVVSGGVDACEEGRCTLSCEPGLASCDGDTSSGCETDTQSAVDHCGGCGRACAPPRASPRCASGQCQVASCEAGYANCDTAVANGCELELGRPCEPDAHPCYATSVGCNTTLSRPSCTRGARLPAGSSCLDTGTCDGSGNCLCPAGSSPNDPCGDGHVCNAELRCVRNVFWTHVFCGTAGVNGTGTGTGDEACRARGFSRALSANGWWWWQCGGPNNAIGANDLCLRYDATGTRCETFCEPGVRSVDCTGSSNLCRTDSRRLRERAGDGSTVFRASDFLSCPGNNPGWSLRVRCEY